MTWNDLAKKIARMPSVTREQQVRFIEPYDEGRSGFIIQIVRAAEDISVGEDAKKQIFVKRGEPLLR